ncbi:MAG: flagellar export chaperone FliS [Syntrophobacteraceae bacterium]
MSYASAAKSYQKTNIETADILKLVILCYERAIKDLETARTLHENNSLDMGYDKIHHAQDIITELLLGLDYERGGEISVNLSKLYNFMLRELMGINSSQDTGIYSHIIKMLSELKEAWEQVRTTSSESLATIPLPEVRSWEARA